MTGPAYDDIVIGSGLAALGAVAGFPAGRRILVIGGPAQGALHHYDAGGAVPSGYFGFGGLGRYWHGVIPTALEPNFSGVAPELYAKLFAHFYPRTSLDGRLGEPWLFIPRRPLRTPAEWQRAERMRGRKLAFLHDSAVGFEAAADGVRVDTAGGRFSAARLWIAAGALQTPALLGAALGRSVHRARISDHVIAYVGQIDRRTHPHVAAPAVARTSDGFFAPALFNAAKSGLFSLKPARFSFRKLDWGIEQRAAFGLPTGGAIAKIARAGSPGLIAEALYNKFGLFPRANMLSVYAQVRVPDALDFDPETLALAPRTDAITAAVAAATHDLPWGEEIERSRRPDLFIPAIHLHHSVDPAALEAAGIDGPGSPVRVIDASTAADIGAEHHSFKMMAGAFARARES